MANKEYFITKLSFRENEQLIKDVTVYEYDGNGLSEPEIQSRQWMVNRINEGKQISIMTPNPEEKDNWVRRKPFTYENGYFRWEFKLPENITKRKTFVSYYHHDDEEYRNKFDASFGDIVVSKSVDYNDIDSDNNDEYIKQLIQNDYLADTTVLVVLIGPKTKCRKHIDWEISGALNLKVGDNNAGLLGLKLPSHPDFGTGSHNHNNLPPRLSDNLKSGYAMIRDWTDDRVKMQQYIEEAFTLRGSKKDKRDNSRIQMQKNICE